MVGRGSSLFGGGVRRVGCGRENMGVVGVGVWGGCLRLSVGV